MPRHRSARRRIALPAAAMLVAAMLAPVGMAGPAYAEVVEVGAGGYLAERPAGASGPADFDGAPVTPKVTERMRDRPVPTNTWWSSLVWQRYPDNPYSENLLPHPFGFRAEAGGLAAGYPGEPAVTGDGRTYEYLPTDDLLIGVDGLDAPQTLVDGWSDWTVTPFWTDGTRTLRATIGHGLPYVYAEVAGGDARVGFRAPAEVWHNDGSTLGVIVGDNTYALFAPTGTSWSVTGSDATVPADRYTVALLPSPDALDLFERYAHSVVTDTRVDWSYDEEAARVTATYTATTRAPEGSRVQEDGTLLALYRHQWLNSDAEQTPYRYASSRGQMRLVEGDGFTTVDTFNGVLPALPPADSVDAGRLRAELDEVLDEDDPFRGVEDTYWTGKHLWRLSALLPIADQLGYDDGRDRLLHLVRDRLTDWLSAADGDTSRVFAYDADWSSLIGYPASFGADTELNDHHFHYGYFVLAAAMVARYDPEWASGAQYGQMVDLLIREGNNYDRGDERFPFLRGFDPYAGHSWASGHAGFAHGNNQESSSESMMFATAAILFGTETGDDAVRDLGIYLYTTERAAIGEYWFDVSDEVFPDVFEPGTVGIVWGAGGAYATWWTANPEEIHGINMLPITGGSLYHGAWPDAIVANIEEMRRQNGGPETEWRDILWQFLAIAEPAEALALWLDQVPEPEEGASRAHTYHWLSSLDAHGTPDHSVTADIPTYAVLADGASRTHIAYNPGSTTRTVTFSDGATLEVQPGSMAWTGS